MKTQLTVHARKRMKGRLGVKSLKKAEILAEKAWINGMPVEKDKLLFEEHVSGTGWVEEEFSVKMPDQNYLYYFAIRTKDECGNLSDISNLKIKDALPNL